jgi:hypothetical protein
MSRDFTAESRYSMATVQEHEQATRLDGVANFHIERPTLWEFGTIEDDLVPCSASARISVSACCRRSEALEINMRIELTVQP